MYLCSYYSDIAIVSRFFRPPSVLQLRVRFSLPDMNYPFFSRTRKEIRRKLMELYSEPLANSEEVLDFDKGYDFFSDNENCMIKYSSKWFSPEKYDRQALHDKLRIGKEDGSPKKFFKNGCDDSKHAMKESAWKLERLGPVENPLTRDLEKLGRTPYHIGLEGEKFRVVAATLQRCNSPFVRRTFQFTSNGIIETPEAKNDGEHMKIFPIINQTKKGLTQKLVTVRRFRLIKKDGLIGKKTVVQEKANGEKPRFLTVRIRSKERQDYGDEVKMREANANPELIRLTSSTEEEDCDYSEKALSPCGQTEETDDGEELVTKTTKPEQQNETNHDLKTEKEDSNDTDYDYESFGKRFPSHTSCFTRSQQRNTCQFCSKRFLSSKQLREHSRTHHPYQRCTRSGGTAEDRIKTATSKFGRTRRVLNIAGLRSKYKML